jgi:hypothetical protein
MFDQQYFMLWTKNDKMEAWVRGIALLEWLDQIKVTYYAGKMKNKCTWSCQTVKITNFPRKENVWGLDTWENAKYIKIVAKNTFSCLKQVEKWGLSTSDPLFCLIWINATFEMILWIFLWSIDVNANSCIPIAIVS